MWSWNCYCSIIIDLRYSLSNFAAVVAALPGTACHVIDGLSSMILVQSYGGISSVKLTYMLVSVHVSN